MSERQYRATLSKGRSGWCVIFRHPVVKTPDRKQQLRVRRGLATRDESEAQRLVEQMNEILSDSSYWNPAARSRAEAKYQDLIVAAFFDHLSIDQRDGWAERERYIPLPKKSDGYATVQLLGTTGAGKTTLVRQLIGTDPAKERFPSTSAAKTTICDMELITGGKTFKGVVSFIPREQARNYIMECVTAAVSGHLEGSQESEIARRFMEHSELRFRLSYVLGSLNALKPSGDDDLLDDDDDDSQQALTDESDVTQEEHFQFAVRLKQFLDKIAELAASSGERFNEIAHDLDIDPKRLSPQEWDTLQDLVEEELQKMEEFHSLVDEVLDEVEARFDFVTAGTLVPSRDGWPILWTYESDDRSEFLKAVNRFSSNYAPLFGRLLTPLVEGIRVTGPFKPEWHVEYPKLVLLDGQGIGHTADSTSSISTAVTRRFEVADAILLVDNAAQPMQAAPVSVLRTLVASGHESKLIVAFTHFDEVKGDNLINPEAKKDHVIGSYFNAVQAIGKASSRDAEHALKRLNPGRIVYLSSIDAAIKATARFTRKEFASLFDAVAATIQPPPPVNFIPIYDISNLALEIQKATQEFHERWNGVLGLGRSITSQEHWTRIKALTRRIGVFGRDEYDDLRPIADLILRLQDHVSAFLSAPLDWSPIPPPEEAGAERVQAIDAIRREVSKRLHELSKRRMIDERLSGWVEAYNKKGQGSARLRAKELVEIYESAAPVPNEMRGPDVNEFLLELRELVAESIVEGGGKLRGWQPESLG